MSDDRTPSPIPVPVPAPCPIAELHRVSNFSFLRGASHPEELVERAAELGYEALAITPGRWLHLLARLAFPRLPLSHETQDSQ